MTKGNSLKDIGMNTFSENNKTCINLVVTTLCIDMPTQDTGVSGMLDFFPWIILNIFGIGLMRTILMAAFKANAFTGKLAGTIESFAGQAIKTAPIIPIAGGVGIGALPKAAEEIRNKMETSQYKNAEIVTKSLDNVGQSAGAGGYKTLGDKQMNEYINATDEAGKKKAITSMIAPATGTFRSEGNNKNELRLNQYGKGNDFGKKLREDVMGDQKSFGGLAVMFKDPEFLKKLREKYPELTADNVKRMYSAEDNVRDEDTLKIWANIDDVFGQPAANATPAAPAPGNTPNAATGSATNNANASATSNDTTPTSTANSNTNTNNPAPQNNADNSSSSNTTNPAPTSPTTNTTTQNNNTPSSTTQPANANNTTTP